MKVVGHQHSQEDMLGQTGEGEGYGGVYVCVCGPAYPIVYRCLLQILYGVGIYYNDFAILFAFYNLYNGSMHFYGYFRCS